jgi:hypothetical protein
VSTKFLLCLCSRDSWCRVVAGGDCSDDVTEVGLEVEVDSLDHAELLLKSTDVPRIYGEFTDGSSSLTIEKLNRTEGIY